VTGEHLDAIAELVNRACNDLAVHNPGLDRPSVLHVRAMMASGALALARNAEAYGQPFPAVLIEDTLREIARTRRPRGLS